MALVSAAGSIVLLLLGYLDAYSQAEDAPIVQATCEGRPGNPVLIPNIHFAELLEVEGDRGARDLIRRYSNQRIFVEIGPAAARDFDVPDAFEG